MLANLNFKFYNSERCKVKQPRVYQGQSTEEALSELLPSIVKGHISSKDILTRLADGVGGIFLLLEN